MSDIRKRKGPKGTNYQVRYASAGAKSGYAYKTFSTLKAARAFTENLGRMRERETSSTGVDVPMPIRLALSMYNVLLGVPASILKGTRLPVISSIEK